MSGAIQATFMNQRSFGPPPPGAIGSAYQGGFYAGSISTTGDGVATHYLVVGPLSSTNTSLVWKTSASATTGTDSFIDGPANTAAMIAAGAADHPCADFCNNLVVGGYDDWYMPARNELEVCYFNLKPTTDSNSTSSGINANAVPPRASNYTSGTPAQTAATAFITGGSEAFATPSYWSSTQFSANSTRAHFQQFLDGAQGTLSKAGLLNLRAIRRVPV
jgi:hypothetical protein